jgi:hypothetical protein
MARIGIDAMFENDLIICREQGSEWKLLNLGVALGANDYLVEESDI